MKTIGYTSTTGVPPVNANNTGETPVVRTTRLLHFLLMVFLAGVAGCVDPSKPPLPVEKVDSINLSAPLPAMVRADDQSVPVGVTVRMFFFDLAKNQPVMITGKLQIALYAEDIDAESITDATPFHVWKFSGDQLQLYTFRTLGLWGYSMQLIWGKNTPPANKITIIAKYEAPGKYIIYSAPLTLAMKQ